MMFAVEGPSDFSQRVKPAQERYLRRATQA